MTDMQPYEIVIFVALVLYAISVLAATIVCLSAGEDSYEQAIRDD